MDLKIGVGIVEYKPKVGLPIMGHFRDDYASRGFHDLLYCRAAIFADSENNRLAIMSLDTCMLNHRQVSLLRQLVQDNTGIPAANVLVAATHTHGAPATASIYTSPKSDDEDIAKFLKNASKAASVAFENLCDAEIKIGYGKEEQLSFNRRLKCKDGLIHMNWEQLLPEFVTEVPGPIDPELMTVSIEQNGKNTAILVNFALHSAIIDYENSDYTADFPGYMSQAMKKIVGRNFITLFFNGCCGNINHIDYTDSSSPRRGFVMAQRCGYVLAADAVEAAGNAEHISAKVVRVSSERVELERFKISDKMYRQAKEFLASSRV